MRSILPVTAVHSASLAFNDGDKVEAYVLVGAGPELRVYRDDILQLESCSRVLPPGTRIHRVVPISQRDLLVFGGRHIALVQLGSALHVTSRVELVEWVFDAASSGDDLLVAIGHGALVTLDRRTLCVKVVIPPEHREMSWSAGLQIAGRKVRVAHGSSFGHIVVRDHSLPIQPKNLCPSTVLHGHAGAVTMLRFTPDLHFLASCSVDRTVRVWTSDSTSVYTPLFVHFGHSARVWDVVFTVGNGVASVGEDSSLRVWSATSSGAHIEYNLHQGRNAWCVHYFQRRVVTGGDDGAVKVCMLSSSSEESNRVEYLLPDQYKSPRETQGAAHNEGVRGILLDGFVMFLATDFGRLLRLTFAEDDVDQEPRWEVLFCDRRGMSFAPSVLALASNVLFAGRADGQLVALDTDTELHSLFGASGKEKTMVMHVMAVESRTDSGANVYAMNPQGETLRWVVDNELSAIRTCTFRHQHLKRNMLVTAALDVSFCNLLVTGDRGGRVSVYSVPVEEDDSVLNPCCFIRPHSDRVSSLHLVDSTRSDMLLTLICLSSGFDGRIAKLRVDISKVVGEEAFITIQVLSTTRTIDRADTIARVLFPSRGDKPLLGRPCVLGFRATDVVLSDLRERNALFRSECGNWRRAFDISAGIREDDRGALALHRLVFTYWRAGKLILQRGGGSPEVVHTIEPSFHGLRVNALCSIPDDADQRAFFLTAGEDTLLRVVRRIDDGWKVEQVLTKHISGVYAVSVVQLQDFGFVAMSGGGCDEVVVWAANCSEGPWRCVDLIRVDESQVSNRTRRVEEDDGQGANHRVLCVYCLPHETNLCDRSGVMAIVGRTDGSVVLVKCNKEDEKWRSRVVAQVHDNKGAAMCVTAVHFDGTLTIVAGDSAGYVCVWRLGLDETCELEMVLREMLHPGGVLGVDGGIVQGVPLYASCGDDGGVCVFRIGEEMLEDIVRRDISAASVTSVTVKGNSVIAAATCQRVWKWQIGAAGLHTMSLMNRVDIEVRDVSQIESSNDDGNAVVCGYGLEVVDFNQRSAV